MGRASILKGPPIMTAYSEACYRAKTAARLFLTRAFVAPGFEAPADLPGYRFTDSATGLVVILTRSGNVDRPATAAARKAAKAQACPPDFRGPSRPLPVTLAQGLLT